MKFSWKQINYSCQYSKFIKHLLKYTHSQNKCPKLSQVFFFSHYNMCSTSKLPKKRGHSFHLSLWYFILQLIEKAGFINVKAEDRTWQFKEMLEKEKSHMEEIKSTIITVCMALISIRLCLNLESDCVASATICTKDKHCKTHPWGVNPGIRVWMSEKTHKFREQ